MTKPKNKKKKSIRLAEICSDLTGFPTEALTDVPMLVCKGSSEVVTDGCRAILEYSGTRIRLDMKDETLLLEGENLVMSEFHRNSLTIRGRIYLMRWEV